jgi:hypothetical protein
MQTRPKLELELFTYQLVLHLPYVKNTAQNLYQADEHQILLLLCCIQQRAYRTTYHQ